MNSIENSLFALNHLLERIALAPNKQFIKANFSDFTANFSANFPFAEIKPNDQLTRLCLLADAKLKRFDDIPEDLHVLVDGIKTIVYNPISLNPVLHHHLKHIAGNKPFENSCINKFIEIANLSASSPTTHDLYYLLGMEWEMANSESFMVLTGNPLDTIVKFFDLVESMLFSKAGTQYSVLTNCELAKNLAILRKNLAQSSAGSINPPTLDTFKALELNRTTHYLPIGYLDNQFCWLHLLAINYEESGFRLRLLTCDGENILPVTDHEHHYCPEVIWKGLSLDQISNKNLWKVLLETLTLRKQELKDTNSKNDHHFALTSTHLVLWITQKLGKRPYRANIFFNEETWQQMESSKFSHVSFLQQTMKPFYEEPLNENTGDLLLRPTGKSLKKKTKHGLISQFINLLALDSLPTKNAYVLYKAETRLLVLTASFRTLQIGSMEPCMRGKFLRLMEQSFGKVTAPLEKLMQLKPSSEEHEAAKILLLSLFDLKHRLNQFILSQDSIRLTGVSRLYPSTYSAHKMHFGNIQRRPIEYSWLDSFPLNEDMPPLPIYSQWTAELYPSIYKSLEGWYDRLLDAKQKCKPIEIVFLAHKNIFSRLPIPESSFAEDTFPDQLSEGLLVGTLILIKKICSVVMAESYSPNSLVSPFVIVDMAMAYRFCVELYRRINPVINAATVSWYGLHCYMHDRHSIHSPAIREALLKLEQSFALISPQGHLRPNTANKVIPLFYHSWHEFPLKYSLQREMIGIMQNTPTTIEQVLNQAELADAVNIKPEETTNSSETADIIKWRNSFNGQCFLTVKEISFFHAMSLFATPAAYQKAIDNPNYLHIQLLEKIGPEDHFRIEPSCQLLLFTVWHNHIGNALYKYVKQIKTGETPMTLRMLEFNDKRIEEPIKQIPVKSVEEWREQADLIKFLPKHAKLNGAYHLHQSASGPSNLSLDVLLEYFEAHANLLLNLDYRSYFQAVFRSAYILEQTGQQEPLFYSRLKNFLETLYQEDLAKAKESHSHVERMLWTSAITRYAGKTNQTTAQMFTPFLERILKDFFILKKELDAALQIRLAPHLLAVYHFLGSYPSVVELARMHLVLGNHPPCEPNETLIWQEAIEAMSFFAPYIQNALIQGDKSLKQELWGLILDSKEEIGELIARNHKPLELRTLAKVSAQLHKLQCKKDYLELWGRYWKKEFKRENPWRETATPKLLRIFKECVLQKKESLLLETYTLAREAKELLCWSATSLVVQSKGRIIHIDWETGRAMGSDKAQIIPSLLPVHLCKHPDLAAVEKLLTLPVAATNIPGKVSLKGAEEIRIDLSTGSVWLQHEEQEYRLIAGRDHESMHLPEVFAEGFSVWIDETGEGNYRGILAAGNAEGKPCPAYCIDYAGCIRPLKGDRELRLSVAEHHAETEIISRWNLNKKMLLIWLNDDNQVKEIHIPLHNGENPFTRMTRTAEGGWQLDGLDVQLLPIEKPIPAFVGHSVYLVAKNKAEQQVLLLTSISPYDLPQNENGSGCWNKILTQGNKDRIHQFKISPSGQVEGLTVADNLLLLLWKIFMGHYAAAAELAKRWLTPPGRAYSKDEENILGCFIAQDLSDGPLENEEHPSALSLRLFILLRIFRHLENYPASAGAGKLSKFAKRVIGGRNHSYETRQLVLKSLSKRSQFGRQMQGTAFHDLLSLYDQETAVRIPFESSKKFTAIAQDLYKRNHNIPQKQPGNGTLLSCHIHGHEVKSWSNKAGDCSLEKILRDYPTIAQSKVIPIKQLQRSLIPAKLIHFFDKAYTLLKEGPGPDEQKDYDAVKHALSKLYTEEAQDTCHQVFSAQFGLILDRYDDNNTFLWLLLHIADQLKAEGKILPELPSQKTRFGLALAESKAEAKRFFYHLIELKGKTPNQIYQDYFSWLYANRSMRYITSRVLDVESSDQFNASLDEAWSPQLTAQINKWKTLQESTVLSGKIEIRFEDWPYHTPADWTSMRFSKENLAVLQEQVPARLRRLEEDLSVQEKKLLLLANALPAGGNEQLLEFARQIHYVTPCSIDECIGLALLAQAKNWQKRCPQTSPEILQHATMLYLAVALETAHVKRIQKTLQICAANNADMDSFDRLQELLAMEKRYLPSTASLPIMACEYYGDCRLRNKPDQAELIAILAGETEQFKGSAIQAIMGSGKSKIIAPIWLQMMLGKWPSAILCVPSSLVATTISDFQTMMWDRFKTHVKAFQFDRESCTASKLYLLAESFHIAQFEPTVFICAPRDLHAFQLMLKERHQICHDMRERLRKHTLLWAETKDFPGAQDKKVFMDSIQKNMWKTALQKAPADFSRWYESHVKLEEELKPIVEESNLLQAISNLIQHQIPLLVDEAATNYDPRNLLSFPIGWQVQANPYAAEAACLLYFDWLPEFYAKLDLLNNMQSYSSHQARQEVYLALAKKAWNHYRTYLDDLPPLAPFTAFLQSDPDKGIPMAGYIDKLSKEQSALRRALVQEICFLKFALTSGLEGAFTSVGHVHYGRSNQDADLYLAIPYECANQPKENTLFKSPWKTVLMTCQYYAQGWRDVRQTADMICFLQGIDEAGKDSKILDAARIVWGRKFDDADVSGTETMHALTNMLDQARLIPDKQKAARLLIRRYLLSCVFATQLKLDPAQMTSTPQDIPMLAVKADAMGGTFGFENTWNPQLKRVADTSCNKSIEAALREPRNQVCQIMPKGGAQAFFTEITINPQRLDGCIALIDAGAHFKGISNQVVAKHLLQALPAFDCVLFWDETQQGGAHLAVMAKTGKKPLEHADKEGIKRALTQMKLKAPFAYYDQARRIGADLDLPDGKALVTFTDIVTKDDLYQSVMRCRKLLDGRHSIVYAIPAEMGRDWTADKVIEIAKQQHRHVKQKANYPAICEQLKGAARALIDKEMRGLQNPRRRDKVYLSAHKLLIEHQENDLVKAFGSLQKMVPGNDALHRLAQSLVNTMADILPSKKEELEKTLMDILDWHAKRQTEIPAFVREGEVQEDAVQEVDLSKDLDRMRLMEEEYERMLGTRVPKKEIAWTHFSAKLIRPSPIGSYSKEEGVPAIYSLKSALAERGFKVPFPSNILVSSNLLFTFEGEANCLLTKNQKPVHRGLFIQEDGKTPKRYVLVTEGDAHYLKEHLYKSNANGICLVEPRGVINQRTKGDQSSPITNLWEGGSLTDRRLLLCALIFQGAAIMLDRLPKEDVKMVILALTQGKADEIIKLRMLLEAALDLQPDEMLHYRRSPKLRGLFMG